MDTYRKEQKRFCYWKPKKQTKVMGRRTARARLKVQDRKGLE